MFGGLGEEVSDSRSANTHKHFDKVRSAQIEERNPSLASNCAGEQGLSCSGRADQQDALWHFATKSGVFVRFCQEVHDFTQLFFGLVTAGHV